MLTANRVRTLLDAIQANWDPFFDWSKFPVAPQAQPRVWRGDNGVILEMDLPGCEAQNIEVAAERNRLSIHVSQPDQATAEPANSRLQEREARTGTFGFELPFPLHDDLIDVVYQHGVLRVTMTKPQEEQRRTLNVRQG